MVKYYNNYRNSNSGGYKVLYKKSVSNSLEKELFENPTSEYRAAPFWAWNCVLDKEVLLSQIESLKKMGFGGFHMHSRGGMSTDYLSDEFMDLVKSCADKAEKEDMVTWLYDEDRWPSGFAGGLLTKDKRYRQRFILLTANKNEGAVDKQTAYINGGTYFVAAYDISLNDKGELESYKRIGENDEAKNKKFYIYSSARPDWSRYNNQAYVDTLSKEAIDKFIDITHEKYKETVGDKFGKSIFAMFTDEPQFARKETLGFATQEKDVLLPWTVDFDVTYKEQYGEDILDYIPELFWEKKNGEVSTARYHFHDHLCERFTRAFADNIGKWCDDNGIALTGHMMEEVSLHSQTGMLGEAMRSYRAFQIPGIDILCDLTEYTTAKQAQSAVHQYAREGMVSELYGVTNWDFDFRGHKFQGDWQAALGVTVRVPHLSWVSMKGSAKRDYPASISEQSPWYKEYKYIEDHYARVNTALTRGKPVVDIGVIHPIESYWLHFGPEESTHAVREQLDERFLELTKWMLFGFFDFDFISEALLPEQVGDITRELSVGAMKYKTIIVPGNETLRSSTLDVLEKYSRNGGKIVFMGECPKYVDAKVSDRVKALYEKSTVIPFDKCSLEEALSEDRTVTLQTLSGYQAGDFVYNRRRDNDCDWLFVARGKKGIDAKSPYKNTAPAFNGILEIDGEYTPVLYDTLDGSVKQISFKRAGGKTVINTHFEYYDSLLLKLVPEKGDIDFKLPESKAMKTVQKHILCDCYEYDMSEPNVLLLDMAQFSIDEGEFHPREEIRRIDGHKAHIKFSRDMRGKLDAQPWVLPDETPEHSITLKFAINSEIDTSPVVLAFEEADKITFNGEDVSVNVTGYYVDRAFKTVQLKGLKKGVNELVVKVPITPRITVENMYLLGDFGVVVKGASSKVVEREKTLGFSSFTEQTLPFYGGNIVYKTKINTPECSLKIKASRYAGALIKVKVDGKDAGKIVFSPYTLTVDGVKAGEHEIAFELFGNRYNTFGALHNTTEMKWAGPNMWSTGGDEFSYEYNLKPTGILAAPIVEVLTEQ